MTSTSLNKLRRLAHRNTLKATRLESKLRNVEKRLAANVLGICFGSRKLLKQQHHLELTSHGDREGWLEARREARLHQVFFVGSKGETGGNLLCQLHHDGNGKFYLKIRLTDELSAENGSKFLIIENVDFAYDRPAIEQALADNVALSWRLYHDERGWRALVSFAHPAAERTTLDVKHGAIGVDFTLTTWPRPTREGASSGQREAALSDALTSIVRRAKEAGKPLVVVDQDFSAKKKALAERSPKCARMLSGLLYAKYL